MAEFSASENKDKQASAIPQNKFGYIDLTVAGIDIGNELIHVAIPIKNANGKITVEVKTFDTTTPDLHLIAQTLKKAGVKTGVMEATGVYWIPLYEILEDAGLMAVLVDPKHVKNPPGRKTDVGDAQWIQTLYSAGLLRAAFRPPRDRLRLRGYVRQRLNVMKPKQVALLHMEKALQLMNIKLGVAVSDIAGFSGLKIIRAILSGERDPKKLAALRSKLCKKDEQLFIDALTGNYQDEHVFSLKQALAQYDFSNTQIAECDALIHHELERLPDVTEDPLPMHHKDKKKHPRFSKLAKPKKNEFSFDVRALLWKKSGIDLTALAGISANTALLIYAELGGADVSAFSSEKAFSSWLKLAPGNNVSGGKRRKSKRQQPSANYISQALRLCAVSAKKSDTMLGAQIRRLCSRSDNLKGIKAGAHKLAKAAYQMIKHGWRYHEMGAAYDEQRHAEKTIAGLHKKAEKLGYKLIPVEAA
jgi:transposase